MLILNPQISKILEVHSGHITLEDNILLEHIVTNLDHEYLVVYDMGFFFRVFIDLDIDLESLDNYGFSDAFINIINEALELGCIYVDFDPDVNPYPELPTFDW
jgi:hypothetical protein